MRSVYLLFVVLQCSVTVRSQDLCKALAAFSSDTPVIDGLSGASLTDFSWVNPLCTANQITYDSGQVDASPVSISFDSTASGISASVERILFVNNANNRLISNITLKFQVNYVSSISGSPTSMSFSGSISKIYDAPLIAASDFNVPWTGKLNTVCQSGYSVFDGNLFDGAPPIVASSCSRSNSPGVLWQVMEFTRNLFGNINVRLDALSLPSSLSETIRGRFLSPTTVTSSESFLLNVNGTISGSLIRTLTSCSDDCPHLLVQALQTNIAKSASSFCTSIDLVPGTLYSELTSEIFASATDDIMYLRSASGTTQALFSCGSDLIGIQLRVISPSQTLPLSPFLEYEVAVDVVNAMRLIPSGTIAGTLHPSAGGLQRILSPNLFSAVPGGFAVPDQLVTTSAVSNIFSQFRSTLLTGNPQLDAYVANLFPSNPQALINSFTSLVQVPTLNEFFLWFARTHSEVQIFFSADGNQMKVLIGLRMQDSIPISDSFTISKFNEQLTLLGQKVRATYASVFPYISIFPIPQVTQASQLAQTSMHGYLTCSLVVNILTGVVSGEAPKSYAVISYAQLDFTQTTNSLFPSATVTYDTTRQYGTISATTIQYIKAYTNGQVELDDSGNLITNTGFPINGNVGQVGGIANDMAGETYSWQGMALDPLSIVLASFADMTASETISALSSQMASIADGTGAIQVAQQLVNYMKSLASPWQSVNVRAVPRPDGSLQMHIFLTTLEKYTQVSTRSTPWEFNVDMQRLKFPVLLQTEINFWVNPTSRSLQTFAVTGSAYVTGFNVPLVSGMKSGTEETSTLQLLLNLPSTSSLGITISAKDKELNDTMVCQIVGRQMGTDDASVYVQVTTEKDRKINPPAVLSNLRDVISRLPTNFLCSLFGAPIPPFGDSLCTLDYMNNDTSAVIALMSSTASSSFQQLAVSESSSASGSLLLNITINHLNSTSCWIDSLDTSSLDNLANSVNNGLEDCSLSQFLTAQVVSQDPSAGTIGIFATVPGIVYSLKISSSGGLSFNNVWLLQTYPAFGTWNDLAWLLSAAFTDSTVYEPPKLQTIPSNTTSDMVPLEMAAVYPAEFLSVILPVKIDAENTAMASLTQQLQANNSVQMFISPDSYLSTLVINNMTAELMVAFECAPQGGGANITVFSNYTSGQNLSTLVVTSPNSTIVFSFNIQQRFPNGTVISQYIEQMIQLTPGKSMTDAMLQDLVPQLPQWIQPMITVGISPGNPVVYSTDQYMVTIQRILASEGSWLVPLSMGIKNSSIDGFGLANPTPPTFRVIGNNIAINVTATGVAVASNATGTIGPVDLATQTVNGQGYTSIQMIQTNAASTARLTMLSVNTSTFFDTFKVDLTVNSSLDFEDIHYDLTSTDLENSQMSFKSDSSTTIQSMTEFNLIGPKIALQSNFDQTTALSEVMLLTSPVWCNALTDLTNIASKIVNNTQQPLPFTKLSLGQMFDKAIGAKLSTIQNNVCSGNQNTTIDTLCKLFESAFGKPVCSSSSLQNNMLEVVIDIVGFNATFANSFLFNTSYYLDTKLPVGIGTDGDLSMNALFTIKLVLQADLSGNITNPQIKIGSATSFTLQTGLDVDGSLTAYFGSVKGSFSNLQLHVGPVVMVATVKKNYEISLKINGTALLEAVIGFPKAVSCKISLAFPNLFGKPIFSGDNFLQILQKVLDDFNLLDWIEDPSVLVSQLLSDTQELINSIFGGDGLIGDLRLPLVGKKLQKMLTNGFSKIFSPDATRNIIDGFANTTRELLKKGVDEAEEQINKLILKEVTKILCKAFEPILRGPCPPVPDENSDVYIWRFILGEYVSEEVQDMDHDLGGHGFARLSMDCGLKFNVDWWLNATLTYKPEEGVKFTFEREPALYATAELEFDPSCEVTGKIGFLGADLQPSGGLQGTLIVNANLTHASVNVTALLEAQAVLGFPSDLSKKITADALEALPYWQAFLQMTWDWNLDSMDTTPDFKVLNTSMCLGHILGKMMNSVGGYIKTNLLDNLQPVLGDDGLLLKGIPTTQFLYGREMNAVQLADLIYHTLCSGDCEFSGVYEAIDNFRQVLSFIQQFENMFQIFGNEPCASFQQLQDWSVNFTEPDPIPRLDPNSIVIPDIQFEPGIPENERKQTVSLVNSINITGSPGISMPLFRNVHSNILNLILGKKNIPFVEVSIPKLSIGSVAHVSVPVWPVPYVELDFGYSCKLTADIGKIVLTVNGLVDAIESKSVGKMFKSLGIPVKNDDGSVKYPITGYLRLEGGVSISIFIFRGSAYAWIELDGKMTFLEIDGDGLLTYDEVAFILKNNGGDILKILDVDLELKGGFGISIQACIRILGKRKCWTITKQEWGATLWHRRYVSKSVNQLVLPDGRVNMPLLLTDLFGGGTTPILRLWDRGGQITADGYPAGVSPDSSSSPLVRYLPQVPIGWKDMSGDPSFIYELNGIQQRVTFPPSPGFWRLFAAENFMKN